MSFKKNNIQKTSPLIPNLIWILALCLIFLLWFIIIKNIDFFTFKVDTIEIIEKKENNDDKIWSNTLEWKKIKEFYEKEKNEDKINILVVWRWGWNHDAPNLTDTIILASIDTKNKIISMLSIPRDFYVEYPSKELTWTGTHENWKINGLYAKYKFKSGSQNTWMEVLKKKVSEITGEKIDYFVDRKSVV